MFLGSVVVSVMMPKLPLYRSLFIFGFLELMSNLVYVLLYFVGKNITLIVGLFLLLTLLVQWVRFFLQRSCLGCVMLAMRLPSMLFLAL